MKSPGVSDAGRDLLQRRSAVVPVVEGKHACHSDHVPDAERAQDVQAELVAVVPAAE